MVLNDNFDGLKPNSLVIVVQKGATCGLYANMPTSANYFKAIDPKNAIEPTEVVTEEDRTAYFYSDLSEGIYHYGVSMNGYTAVCQIIHYTASKAANGFRVNVELSAMAGDGYESGYVMLNTQEFIDAQLRSHKDAWGQKYAHLFRTPQFTRPQDRPGRHQQTTNEELWDFINKLQTVSENMYVYSLGRSPKYGFEMPLVLFTRENVSGMLLEQAAKLVRSNGKPTVQYTAQVHSNEPGSAEGALAMMLDLTGGHCKQLLDAVDVYIIPRINLDGAIQVIRTSPTTGDDMNRDYLYMNNREIRMVTGAYNLFLPEAAIDGHEKNTNFLTADEARCTDMELQVGAGSLNHPAAMTELSMKIVLMAIEKGQSLGLRSHFYSNLASAAGGSAGSSYYGTRNSLAFLVETPGGTTLGRNCMERRVMAQYTLASTVLAYAAEHACEVMDTVHASRNKMITCGSVYDEADQMVLEHGNAPTGSLMTPMINVLTGEVTDPSFEIAYNEQPIADSCRPRPTAYVIPKGLPNEAEILRVADNHAIPHYCIPAGCAATLRQYIRQENGITLSDDRQISFAEGAYVFPNTVPSTILSVIMEPDFNTRSGRKMCLVSMGLVTADREGCLPVYRYCRDLADGKICVSTEIK